MDVPGGEEGPRKRLSPELEVWSPEKKKEALTRLEESNPKKLWPELTGLSRTTDEAIERLAMDVSKHSELVWPARHVKFARYYWASRMRWRRARVPIFHIPGYESLFVRDTGLYGAKKAILRLMKRTRMIFVHDELWRAARIGVLHIYSRAESADRLAVIDSLPFFGGLAGSRRAAAVQHLLGRGVGIIRLRENATEMDPATERIVAVDYVTLVPDMSGNMQPMVRAVPLPVQILGVWLAAHGATVLWLLGDGGAKIGRIINTPGQVLQVMWYTDVTSRIPFVHRVWMH